MNILKFMVVFLLIGNWSERVSGQDLITDIKSQQLNGRFIGGLKGSQASFPKFEGRVDVTVKNKKEFLDAIKSDRKYYTIYIDESAVIDLSDQRTLFVKTGVKIISNRGVNGSKGALLITKTNGIFPLFECGSSVTFYGLRIQGSDTNVYAGNKKRAGLNADYENKYGVQISQGIRTQYKNLIVENCELSGWTHSAIIVKGSKASGTFKYNYIHHNRRHGLGYGITIDGGYAEIIGNRFDYNRHDIASTGVANSSYTVKNNVFLENGTSHAVDVHGGRDRKDNTNLAGRRFEVSNNTFMLPFNRPAFVVRGVPSEQALFANNKIIVSSLDRKKMSGALKSRAKRSTTSVSSFVIQKNAKGKLITRDNTIE